MKFPICGFPLVYIAFLLSAGCSSTSDLSPESRDDLPREVHAEPIRNVILIIGDGMGPQQVGLLQDYAERAPNSIYEGRSTALELFADEGVVSFARTAPHDGLVVDSACSATHLATGQDALLEAVGVDREGAPAKTILEVARDLGKSTGIVSNTRITHATPASFAAHINHRTRENEIGQQMLDADIDVMLSGGLRHFLPRATDRNEDALTHYYSLVDGAFPMHSAREDDLDLLAAAKDAGYQLVFHRDQLDSAESARVLGLFSNSGMLDAIEERTTREDPDRSEPNLAQMASDAIERLDQNPNGFFLMIEGGQIDWAGHDNDAGLLLHEMIQFDEMLADLRLWADGRDDTLILVAADHETGGFGFSYSGANIPAPQHRPGSAFAELPYHPNYNFGSLDVLDGLFAQRLSFADMLARFHAGEHQSPQALMQIVNAHSQFHITLEDVEDVLRSSPNQLRSPGHPYLDTETQPHIDDFSAFYVYGEDSRRNLLGRAMATEQNTVWSTGTHTHTPVPVIAWGPDHLTRPFDRFLHLKDVGRMAIESMGVEYSAATR